MVCTAIINGAKIHCCSVEQTKDKTSIIINNHLVNKSNLEYKPDLLKASSIIRSAITYQHLYITTDDEIKEDDWIIHKYHLNKIIRAKDVLTNGWVDWYKIIATTDKSLKQNQEEPYNMKQPYYKSLPQPSQAFIEKYCKVGGIDEVLVEYHKKLKVGYCSNCNGGFDRSFQCTCTSGKRNYYSDLKLKIDSHNTITIHPIKNSWTREEVEILLTNYANEFSILDTKTNINHFNNWIKKNL